MANTYIVHANNITYGNGKQMACIWNTSASVVSVRRIAIYNNQINAGVTGVVAELRLRRITAVGVNGTFLTINKTLSTIPTPTNISAMTASTTVTSTDVFERIYWSTDEGTPTEYNLDTFENYMNYTTIFEGGYGDTNVEPIVCRTNQGVELSCITNTTVGSLDIFIEFTVV